MSDFPPEPAPQFDGYLVVLRPAVAYQVYVDHARRNAPDPAAFDAWVAEVREALPSIDPERYAGWDREAIRRAVFPPDPGCPPPPPELLMLERLGEDPTSWWDTHFVNGSVIPEIAIARDVLAVTQDPKRYEVIRVVRIPEEADGPVPCHPALVAGPNTLGYDVGYWGGSFSLLSDTMVCHRWHPPPPEAWPEVRRHAAALNDQVLFASAADALAFRAWYREQAWAEDEDFLGQFTVARIDWA